MIAKSSFKNEKQKRWIELLKQIEELDPAHKRTQGKKTYKKLLAVHRELGSMETDKIRKQMLFVKQKYLVQSSKSLKSLSWHVSQHKSNRRVHAIRTKAGDITHLMKDILARFSEYYAQLYSASSPDVKHFSDFLNKSGCLKKLLEEHRKFLNQVIREEEVKPLCN